MAKFSTEYLNIKDQQRHPDPFPLVYKSYSKKNNIDDVNSWLKLKKNKLLDQLESHGAILFRGFPIKNDIEFDRFVDSFKLENLLYDDTLSNAIRLNRTTRVFTSNEAPSNIPIFLHHELAQTPLFPSHLFFFCERPSHRGGETILCRSDVLLEHLIKKVPDFITTCEKLGVRYKNIMPASEDKQSGQGRSWCNTFGTNKKELAEEKLRALNYDWEWKEDGSLIVTTSPRPAIRKTQNNRRVFFNQLIAAYLGWKDKRNNPQKTICFGDGSNIPNSIMSTISEIADQLSFNLKWKKGDIAMVNNLLVLHGRKPFQGNRSVLASLAINKSDL